MSQAPPPGLALALLTLLLTAKSDERTGPTTIKELLDADCDHKRQAKYLDASVASAAAMIQDRLRGLGRPDAVMLSERAFLESLADALARDRAYAQRTRKQETQVMPDDREVAADDDTSAAKHAAFSAASQAEPGEVRAGVAHPMSGPEPTEAQVRASEALGRGLSEAAAELMRKLNDDLPPGFVAHLTLTRKDD